MDVVQQLANMGNEFIGWMQILGVVGSAIAFGIGGFIIRKDVSLKCILTGGTGSGKSHVGSMLKERHAYIADADVIAHEIIEKEKPAYNELVEHFGKGILDENDDIIRRKLGDIVFSDKKELEFLDECSDIHTVLTQSGANRGGSGCLSGVNLKLNNASDFLCHNKHLLNKMW